MLHTVSLHLHKIIEMTKLQKGADQQLRGVRDSGWWNEGDRCGYKEVVQERLTRYSKQKSSLSWFQWLIKKLTEVIKLQRTYNAHIYVYKNEYK